jgi:hypothetical protein
MHCFAVIDCGNLINCLQITRASALSGAAAKTSWTEIPFEETGEVDQNRTDLSFGRDQPKLIPGPAFITKLYTSSPSADRQVGLAKQRKQYDRRRRQ